MYQQPRPQQLQRSLSQKKRDQAEARKAFSNEWQVGLFNAPCSNPGYCCYAFFCGSCAAYGQRKLQMGPAWPSQYTCCNGGTCISGRCGERSNPELCLCCEVCCCFPSAMATTRFMIQDEQRVMNTKCDNCLIGFMLCTQQLALCLRCIAMITNNPDIESLADAVDCLADLNVTLAGVRVHVDAATDTNSISRLSRTGRRRSRPHGSADAADDAARRSLGSARRPTRADADDVRVHGTSAASRTTHRATSRAASGAERSVRKRRETGELLSRCLAWTNEMRVFRRGNKRRRRSF